MVACALAVAGCGGPKPGTVPDEAMQAKRTAASFPAADEDYFREMDGGIALTPEEVKGRNTWIVWSGGNDRFWDTLTVSSAGTLDFLKTLSSHPDSKLRRHGREYKLGRDNRWYGLGLVNEPCFEKATGPDPERFGLWLDKRKADCPPDPFENEQKYPGVAVGARGKTVPLGSYYGYASGIVGLRLFPNPDFDEAAAKKWDPVRYYTDPTYYEDKNLVRPYRVGMSCGFCHVGPIPTNPPDDPENPTWKHLSSIVGAQYFWVDTIFVWESNPAKFQWQLFHTSRPGALDTSFVSTDYINNPRTMNAVYGLGARLEQAKRWGKETLSGGNLDNKQFQDYVTEGPLLAYFDKPDTVYTPRVLKDGSDSVGALGALNRVYLNIGMFSEEWMLHFNALVGGKPTTPIRIADAQKNSVYWQVTEQQTPATALFFLKSTDAHKLKDAPGGAQHLTKDAAVLERGKVVFAETCARCHSSKLPEAAPEVDPGGCAGKDYLACFDRYWAWTKTPEFKQKMRDVVLADDFLDNNYLSTELRIPSTLMKTNACSALATNALAGDIWDNFSSQSYKDLPSVGKIRVHHPITGEPRVYEMPAGGRGYTRPASLISVWSTAPFLLNNSLGKFDYRPSVEGRMASFSDSIEQLLWPEKREKDNDARLQHPVPGIIDRTTEQSYLRVSAGYLPDLVQPFTGKLGRHLPWLFDAEGIEIGPIPKGTPVNLLSNLNPLSDSTDSAEKKAHKQKLLAFLRMAKKDLKALPEGASDEEARKAFANLVEPLLELSRCPDFVVNRGHYFGTSEFKADPELGDERYFEGETPLSDADKRALIEFVKTF
jgi:hypothetical protein